jgi:hypothetical protein
MEATTTVSAAVQHHHPQLQQQSPVPLQLDLDTSPIPGQQSYVVLDLFGNLVKSSCKGSETLQKDYSVLYQMLQETAAFSQQQVVKRISIVFDSLQYIIARDETHIYVVQTTIKGPSSVSEVP